MVKTLSPLGDPTQPLTFPEKTNPLLYHYYTNRKVLGFVCCGNEFLYIGLYAYHWNPSQTILVMTILMVPIWLFKQVTNVIQLQGSMQELADIHVAQKSK